MSNLFARHILKLRRLAGLVILFLVMLQVNALALNLNVVGPNGEAVTAYRWVIEEDAGYHVNPGQIDPLTLGVKFHTSYMPVISKGNAANSSNIILDPSKHYFVSVLPDSGYTNGGTPIAPGQANATVAVNRLPLPTAQIAVLAFEDNQPINNAPNVPAERGLEGFSILVFDAGGRYGMAGGQMSQDVYGNPLGTTYDAQGNMITKGTGVIKTDANGRALIKYLPQGKYGIKAIPPAGQNWIQTSTLEGTRMIDAWVKPNEPPFFTEFGPPGQHVSLGFIQPFTDTRVLSGGKTITGRVVNLHLSSPPFSTFNSGNPVEHTIPWVGLNELTAGVGRGVFAKKANADGTFSIPNVPAGDYQLVVWDENLDFIIALLGVKVTAGGGIQALGDVPVFQWFSRLESIVFYDHNQNGFRDCVTATCDNPQLDDIGIPDVPVNIRFRDGTMYQSLATDTKGFVPFDEVFPFFSWLIAEVDFARLKATGATVIVDAGGPISPDQGWTHPSRDKLTPQPQKDANGNPIINPNTNNNLTRTEIGPVLLEAFQGFLGQTNIIEWGKSAYGPGENGGITGIVRYATTRAENDPRYAVPEVWEPGIPRVQVNLYRDTNMDKAIDDVNNNGNVDLADIDNYPFGWSEGGAKGPEDVERSGNNGVFDLGDALQFVRTDSWDDNVPTSCQGEKFVTYGVTADCFDGFRPFNQVRPGVFDGGYAFSNVAKGTYIVEAIPPRSEFGTAYQTLKEEDKNVDFGDTYIPSPLLLPPVCVNYDENNGSGHLVPAELALFPGVPSVYAGTYRPLCDRKQISVSDGMNAAVDFAMFTEVPIAGHIKGFLLDDTANEFDPNSPQFGEKYAPPFLPISIRDWTGKELSRTYSDHWGAYNALVPSTYTTNAPEPSGVSPQMITTCLNDPGPVPDPGNPAVLITDPFFNRQYSQFCYTFQYMPGTTTYLDTPVVPVAAFAGPGQYPLDCEYPEGTPKIYSVNGQNGTGPYVQSTGQRITIVSEGLVDVPNPLYEGIGGTTPQMIKRDYGFGTVQGTVTLGTTQLQIVSWTAGTIVATVPAGAVTGQLAVTRGDNGKVTKAGVTVTVGNIAGTTVRTVAPTGSIQQAIDLSNPGDLILVPPGVYNELVIMWKPVRLQGWGAASTIINAAKRPAEKLVLWRQKLDSLINSGVIDLLPAQVTPINGFTYNFPEEGAGITVLAKNVAQAQGGYGASPNARVDGFTVTGSDIAGAVFVNGYAHYFEASNNRIINNQGIYGGGVISGHPNLTLPGPGLTRLYQSSFNDNVRIHNNHITQNSGLNGAGGGVSLYTGSDFYQVTNNYICGNFSMGDGAGIGHLGLSNNGVIGWNTITFNQSFNQGLSVSGGGIVVSGAAPLNLGTLSDGSGSVRINANLIQGNLAGAGDGGGIRTNSVNGQDVVASRNTPDAWYAVDIFNNMIVNNAAGLAGGGISLQDTARVNIFHNTIANNDSTGTAGAAFAPGSPSQSTPQPAGIVSRAHSDLLAAAFGTFAKVQPYKEFANPSLADNIIWHNRSFYFLVNTALTPPTYSLVPDLGAGQAPVYWDLWVLGTALQRYLNPQYCNLTSIAGYNVNNISTDPMFVSEYFNGAKNQIIQPEITTAIQVMPAFDEGGNFIDVRFGPLSIQGDYHLRTGSRAINRGLNSPRNLYLDLTRDFDGQLRPNGLRVDIGADEKY
ncbi:MAG: hypothetical protein HYS21_11335 [Deltaproteobacteria bacterium]|nr:hypothetical protein [Deltaproteobacteria bacterium]